jgi:hypothetical protein
MLRILKCDPAKQCANRGEPDITRPRAVVSRLLQVVQEGKDRWNIKIRNLQNNGLFAGLFFEILQKEFERVAIARDGLWAHAFVDQ